MTNSETDEQVYSTFKELINMTSAQLKNWLSSANSKRVGWKGEGQRESVGHQSGRKIIKLLEKKDAPHTAAEIAHMRKVVSYIRRHSAQRPTHDKIANSRWRYSLMNWGHDPLKD